LTGGAMATRDWDGEQTTRPRTARSVAGERLGRGAGAGAVRPATAAAARRSPAQPAALQPPLAAVGTVDEGRFLTLEVR